MKLVEWTKTLGEGSYFITLRSEKGDNREFVLGPPEWDEEELKYYIRQKPLRGRVWYEGDKYSWTGVRMSSTGASMIAELELDPCDISTRLVYADWLEENNQPVMAQYQREFVRAFQEAERFYEKNIDHYLVSQMVETFLDKYKLTELDKVHIFNEVAP